MYGRLTVYLCFRKSFGGAALVSSRCQHESIKVRGTISTLLVATTLLSGNMFKLGSCLVGDSHGIGFHIFTGYWGSGNISEVYIALWLVITTRQRSYGKVLFSVVSVQHCAHSAGGSPLWLLPWCIGPHCTGPPPPDMGSPSPPPFCWHLVALQLECFLLSIVLVHQVR